MSDYVNEHNERVNALRRLPAISDAAAFGDPSLRHDLREMQGIEVTFDAGGRATYHGDQRIVRTVDGRPVTPQLFDFFLARQMNGNPASVSGSDV